MFTEKYQSIVFYATCFILCIITVFASTFYKGNVLYYYIFSLVFNLLLLNGFLRNRMFFDLFIGGFLWLGFWAKFTYMVLFYDSKTVEPLGFFTETPEAYDLALKISIVGGAAFLLASFLWSKYKFLRKKNHEFMFHASLNFYNRFRVLLWMLFIFISFGISVSNFALGIYQRGMSPITVLPFGLGGIYTWLLLFGLSSIFCWLFYLETKATKKISYLFGFFGLLEHFLSNVSMLSRAMLLNSGAFIFALIKECTINMKV